MQYRQRGWLSNVVILLFLFFFAWCAWDAIKLLQPAKHADVMTVVEQAQASTAATKIVVDGLKKWPTPNVAELSTIRDRVNEQLVLEASRAVAGDGSLGSRTAQAKQTPSALDGLLSLIMFTVVFGLAGWWGWRHYKSAIAGPPG